MLGRKSRGRKGQGRGIKVGVKNIDAYSSTFWTSCTVCMWIIYTISKDSKFKIGRSTNSKNASTVCLLLIAGVENSNTGAESVGN